MDPLLLIIFFIDSIAFRDREVSRAFPSMEKTCFLFAKKKKSNPVIHKKDFKILV